MFGWNLLVDDRANEYTGRIPERDPVAVIRRTDGLLIAQPSATTLVKVDDVLGPLHIATQFAASPTRAVAPAPRPRRITTISPPRELYQLTVAIATKLETDPALPLAVIDVESGWNIHSVSTTGAMGLMQLMPSTARDLGVTDPFDPQQNITAGTALLKRYSLRYQTAEEFLAAYRSGPGNLASRGVSAGDRHYTNMVRAKYWAYRHAIEDAIISEGP